MGYIINFIAISSVLCTSVDSSLDPFYSRKLILFILGISGCAHVTILWNFFFIAIPVYELQISQRDWVKNWKSLVTLALAQKCPIQNYQTV